MEYLPPICVPMPPPKAPPVERFDGNAHFMPNQDFLKVLRKVPGVNPTQLVFTYRQICSIFSEYLVLMKNYFFDARLVKLLSEDFYH